MTALEAVADYVRDAAFTTLNRFIALKMLEARELVQECITKGEQSSGYREFCGMAPGLALIPMPQDIVSILRACLTSFRPRSRFCSTGAMLRRSYGQSVKHSRGCSTILNASELVGVWVEDETIGWVYQFFNSGEERKNMRDESQRLATAANWPSAISSSRRATSCSFLSITHSAVCGWKCTANRRG